MTMMRTAAIVALLAGCAMTSFDVHPAQALTLMDLIRGKKQAVQEEMPSLPGVEGAVLEQKPQQSAPLPRVTGPRYYTYKAEPMRRIATAKLADPVVTGSIGRHGLPPMLRAPLSDARQFLPDVRAAAPGEVAKAVESFYGSHETFVWVEGSAPNARARAALAVLADAARIGLDPQDYAVATPPDAFDRGDMIAREKALVQFEISLSAATLTYVADTVRGRIDPNKISGYHDFKRKSVDLEAILDAISGSGDVRAFLEGQTPAGPHFLALRRELEALRATADEAPRIEIAPGTLLKPGISHPDVANVVAAIRLKASDALKTEHSLTLLNYKGTPDYTPDLVALVEGFQKENGLKPDGVVGKASIRVLTGGDTTADKVNKVQIAMEQARWLPADLGSRHVFINQPAYIASYAEGGVEQFSMRVVVGSKANQTYFFEDQIQTVEFNPYWGVPQSIIINEMLPKLRADPNYLDRLGYQVEVAGQAVASSSVDWHGSTASVAVRQPPSSDNALGELKILFPNSHAIYMHDTPSKSFFNRDQRALSHGCVRLAEPRRMAAAVLGITEADVADEIAGGRNKGVSVPGNIPVYIAYFTAWPNKDGVVEYFDDVYERDMYMNRALDATRTARHSEG